MSHILRNQTVKDVQSASNSKRLDHSAAWYRIEQNQVNLWYLKNNMNITLSHLRVVKAARRKDLSVLTCCDQDENQSDIYWPSFPKHLLFCCLTPEWINHFNTIIGSRRPLRRVTMGSLFKRDSIKSSSIAHTFTIRAYRDIWLHDCDSKSTLRACFFCEMPRLSYKCRQYQYARPVILLST